MTLPADYDPTSVQREIDQLNDRINLLLQYIPMQPLAAAPLNPKEGWTAISDGTGSGFDGSSGAGMYRYNGSAWVFVG